MLPLTASSVSDDSRIINIQDQSNKIKKNEAMQIHNNQAKSSSGQRKSQLNGNLT
jgi:hypothetical protein